MQDLEESLYQGLKYRLGKRTPGKDTGFSKLLSLSCQIFSGSNVTIVGVLSIDNLQCVKVLAGMSVSAQVPGQHFDENFLQVVHCTTEHKTLAHLL